MITGCHGLNSYGEALTPSVAVFGRGPVGRGRVVSAVLL